MGSEGEYLNRRHLDAMALENPVWPIQEGAYDGNA